MLDKNGVNEAVTVSIPFFQKRLFSDVVRRHIPETTFRSPWKHANCKLRRQWRNPPSVSVKPVSTEGCVQVHFHQPQHLNRMSISENNNNKPRPPQPTSVCSTSCGCRSWGAEHSGLDVLLRIRFQNSWDVPEKEKRQQISWDTGGSHVTAHLFYFTVNL